MRRNKAMSRYHQDRYVKTFHAANALLFEHDETNNVKVTVIDGKLHLLRAKTKFASHFWLGFDGLDYPGKAPGRGSIANDLYQAGRRAKQEAKEMNYLLSVHRNV